MQDQRGARALNDPIEEVRVASVLHVEPTPYVPAPVQGVGHTDGAGDDRAKFGVEGSGHVGALYPPPAVTQERQEVTVAREPGTQGPAKTGNALRLRSSR